MRTLKNCLALSSLAVGLCFSTAGYGAVEVKSPESSQKEGVKIVPDRRHGSVQVAPPNRQTERAEHKRGDAQREGVSVVPERKRGNATILSGAVEDKARRNAEAKRKAEARRNAARDRNSNRGTVEVKPGDAQREGVSVVPERKRGNATVLGGAMEDKARREAEARRNAARDRNSNRGTVEVR